jgi:hypothetical protein
MRTETQETVVAWVSKTYGPATDNRFILDSAKLGMVSLVAANTANDRPQKIVEAAADVVIMLASLARNLGTDLWNDGTLCCPVGRGAVEWMADADAAMARLFRSVVVTWHLEIAKCNLHEVVFCLAEMATMLGFDLFDAVDNKMAANRRM